MRIDSLLDADNAFVEGFNNDVLYLDYVKK